MHFVKYVSVPPPFALVEQPGAVLTPQSTQGQLSGTFIAHFRLLGFGFR
jgi:hypothetical protein